jgi:heterodisulfide reductase subunit C
MHIIYKNQSERVDPDFRQLIEQKSGAHLDRCYQCYTCALGCPVAFATDFTPNQIIRMVQMGLREQALQADLIWMCASCETCAARCPNEIEIVKIMDVLRVMSLQKPGKKVKDISFTHQVFIKLVETFGRMYELGFIMGMKLGNLRSLLSIKGLLEDGILGFKMFSRGKLHLFPHKTRGAEHIKRIVQRIKANESEREKMR